MGAQLCGFNGSYEQLQKELMQNNQIQKFLARYPLIQQNFKIKKVFYPICSFESMSRKPNGILFKSTFGSHINDPQEYFGLIFEEHNGTQNNQPLHKASFYQGQLNQYDIKQGKGYAIFDNGDSYEGQWNNNCIQGSGKYNSIQNAMEYQGQFKQWKKSGKGNLLSKVVSKNQKKFTYLGQFKNDQINGKGRVQYDDGSLYEGQLKNGLQQGFGVYIKKQMKYQGTWVKGLMDGSGTCWWFSQNGQIVSKYIGQYKSGKKHGFGEYLKKNGRLMRGQWLHGKFNPGVNSYIIQ